MIVELNQITIHYTSPEGQPIEVIITENYATATYPVDEDETAWVPGLMPENAVPMIVMICESLGWEPKVEDWHDN